MPTLEGLKDYLRLMPDDTDATVQLAMNAALHKADAAGVPRFKYNAHYDLFVYALAALWFDNRGMTTPGTATVGGDEAVQSMVNRFVGELRHAQDGAPPPEEVEGDE